MGFSKYPNELDDSTTLPPATDLITPVKAEVVNRLRDAIIALEYEIGVQPSSVYATLRARLEAMDGKISTIEQSADSDASELSDLINSHIANLSNPHNVTTTQIGAATAADLTAHTSDTGNPHSVTTTQIGAATAADLTAHTSDMANPHGVTVAQIGAVASVGSSTDEAVVRFDLTSGAIQDSPNGPFAADDGTLSVITGVAIGSDPAATGAVRLTNDERVVGKQTGGSDADLLYLSTGNIVTFGNDSTSSQLRGASTINVAIAGILRAQFNAAGISILGNDIQFSDTSATAPHLYQGTKSASGVGDLFTINSQDSSAASGTGGSMLIRAGDGTNTGSIGGDLDLRPGDGQTTDGALSLQDGTSTDRIQIGTTGSIILNGAAQVLTQVAGGNVWRGLSTSVEIFKPLMYFTSSTVSPTLYQNDDTANSITGDTLLIHAQNCTGSNTIGGDLTLNAGSGTDRDGYVNIGESNTTFVNVGVPFGLLEQVGDPIDWDPNVGYVYTKESGGITELFYMDDMGSVTQLTSDGYTDLGGSGTDMHLVRWNGTSALQDSGVVLDDSDNMSGLESLSFDSLATSPMLYQEDDIGGGATGDLLTIHSQDCSGASSTGGALLIRSGVGTSSNGSITIQGGSELALSYTSSLITVGNDSVTSGIFRTGTNGLTITRLGGTRMIVSSSVINYTNAYLFQNTSVNPEIAQNTDTTNSITGDTLTIRAQDCTGTTTTGGTLALRPGTGTSANGELQLKDAAGNNRFRIDASNVTYVDAATDIRFTHNTVLGFRILNTGVINYTDAFNFSTDATNPTMVHLSDTVSTTGDTFSIIAQDLTTATGTKTAGALLLRAGDSTGGSTNNGGDLTLRSGDGDGTTTAGDIFIAAGSGASGISVLSTAAATNGLTIGGVSGGGDFRPDITLDGSTFAAIFRTAGTWRAAITATELDMVIPLLSWRDTVSLPIIRQDDITTAGVSGQTFTIHAQDSTGTGTKAGGDMFIRAGNASGGTDTGGDVMIQAGLGDGGFSDGFIYLNSADGYARLTVFTTGTFLGASNLSFEADVSSPVITQNDEEDLTVADTMTISAQTNTVNGGTGGHLYVHAGDGTNATAGSGGDLILDSGTGAGTGVNGNIALLVGSSPSWNSMEKGLFLGDATTIPAGNPTSGIYVYSEGGAGKARGSSGTTTTWAPADPHCPTCGRDCAVEWKNDIKGWELSVCMWCITDAIGNVGLIKKEQK